MKVSNELIYSFKNIYRSLFYATGCGSCWESWQAIGELMEFGREEPEVGIAIRGGSGSDGKSGILWKSVAVTTNVVLGILKVNVVPGVPWWLTH